MHIDSCLGTKSLPAWSMEWHYQLHKWRFQVAINIWYNETFVIQPFVVVVCLFFFLQFDIKSLGYWLFSTDLDWEVSQASLRILPWIPAAHRRGFQTLGRAENATSHQSWW
jgi:hypothetical protein